MVAANKKEAKNTGDPAAKKRKQQEEPVSAVAARTTEEFNFPRGGASVLTPLEHKEISRKADQDVLFSNDGSSAATQAEEPATKKRKSNKGKANKKSTDATPQSNGKEKVKIESLSFKRLNVGMTMLGCISKINDLSLVVSLPHQLVGSVAITEISDSITKAVETVAQAEEEDEEGALPDLSTLFKVGQWVRCCIIQLTGSDEQQGVSMDKRSKQKKRIDLSLKPDIVNSGVSANDFAKGMCLGMAVQSVEDHGYILSTGVDGITGFCHNKDAKKYIESYNNGNPLVEGQLVQCGIVSVPENKRTVNVTLDPKQVIDVTFDEPCSVINSIVPGNLISATVSAVHATGLILGFMGFFEASVDLAHINARPEEIDTKYTLGQKVKARILFCSLNTTPKKIGASLLPNIVSLKQDNTPIEDQFPIGTIFDRVVVKRVDSKNGLDVDIDGHDHVRGFVHISRVSDSHIDALSATAGDYKLDTAHRGRVVGHSLVDNLLQLSMEESVLDQQFMRVNDIQVGTLVEGTVLKLTEAGLIVNLAGSITALAPRLHLADVKLTHPEKKFKIGSKVKGLVMISDPTKRRVIITLKRSIVNSDLPVLTTYEDAKPGMIVHGTISGFRPFGCIISYCNNVRALAPISELSDSFVKDPAENFQLGQTIKTRILTVDPSSASLRVSFKTTPPAEKPTKEGKKDKTSIKAVVNPIDSTIVNAQDYSPGRITKAKVTNVKENQVNLDLADNVKGRVHITEAFNDFNDIKNLKHPLRRIHHGSIIDVMVLGQHDSKSHTYLPISHRGKSNAMVECSLKFNPDAMDVDAESTKKPLEFKDLKQGDKYIGFVSEVNNDSLMVNIGTNLRGRISKMHVSQDVQVLNDLTSNYIVGQALHTVVLSVDEEKKRVDLANITDGEFTADVAVADINSLEQGLVVRGTVTKADASRGVVVKLADHLFGKIHLTDIADDFVKDPTSKFEPGHIVRCYVLSVDKDTKKIDLSTRKSRLEQADSASIADPEIVSLDDIKPDAIVKGYVQNVADKGLFVFVGRDTVGRVKISELSDDFVKDWKAMFKAGQVVEAKILSVNKEANQLELTLKKSAIDPTIGPKKTLADFSQGEKVKGVVTSVKPIGVFIKVENSVVSGLCHISQISDTAVSDVSKIYSIGDPVKAMILNVDLTKKRISFGLKASYFDEEEDSEDEENDLEAENDDLEAEEDDEEGEDMLVDDDEEENDDDDEIDGMANLAEMSDSEDEEEDEQMEELQDSDDESVEALPVASGFSWTGESAPVAEEQDSEADQESESEDTPKKKKNKKSKDIVQDKTGDLSTQAPQVAADYERLLLGSPNSSYLWINYMAFQLQLSEVDKAREIGERALTKISFREEQEKLNVWVAMMNLENTFGTADSLEAVFKRAVIVCEPKKVYLQLVKIYERSNKFDKAEELWNTTVKKFSQSSKVWTLFGMFYLQQGNVEGARQLLQRSLQSLPKRKHIKTIVKFAQMEFKHGEAERGRTIFEGVMSNYPKRVDLWSIYLDMEIRAAEQDIIRRLFQRVTTMKHSSKKMKFFFKKWLAYEKDHGTEKDIEEVKKRALAYVESISS